MTLEVSIVDSTGEGNSLRVSDEGAASVVVHPHPPVGEQKTPAPFRQFFTTTGDSTGDNDMRVNGSVNNQLFCVAANHEVDIFIKTVSVYIADAGANLDQFGANAALTNGLLFQHETTDLGTTVINDGLKTNLEFVRLSQGNPAFGSGTGAFQADVSGAGADAYLPTIDFQKTFGLTFGLRLRRNTTDKLAFYVRDDLSTGIDQFDITAYGIKL